MSLNRDFVLDMFRHIDSRDWEGLRLFFCSDIVYERPGYPPIEGLDDLIHFYRDVRVIASGEHQLSQIVVNDDAGASWGRFLGQHHNGSPLDERFADCYTFEDGKVKHRISYFFRAAI